MHCNDATNSLSIIPVRHGKLRGRWHKQTADIIITSNFHYWLCELMYVHPGTFLISPCKLFFTKVHYILNRRQIKKWNTKLNAYGILSLSNFTNTATVKSAGDTQT